ncbi:FADS6 isoform 1, partial [Pan troglodytes]
MEPTEPMEPARSAPRGGEALLRELEVLVQDVVRTSSWWERHGVDCAILALSLLALPAGVHSLHCRACHAWAHQDAPCLHQRGGPGGLQHVEAALPQPLC